MYLWPVNEMKILLIEDNPDDVFLTKRVLDKLGYSDIDVAFNGSHALEYLFGSAFHFSDKQLLSKPDLVLLDQRMPITDGIEFMEAIHSVFKHNNIPVIIITSSTLEREKQRLFELGVIDYVGKPVNVEGLKRALKSIAPPTH